MSTDDPEQDRIDEQSVCDDLAAGNRWAWCYIVVFAHCGDFEGRSGLGGCSYSSEQAFLDERDTLETLKHDARLALTRTMVEAYQKLYNYLEM